MTTAAAILTIILAMYTHGIGMHRMRAHADTIAAQAQAASDNHHVPVALLLAVCLSETHCGQDDHEGNGWGSPIDRRHRHTAGTADSAARDLAHSFEICGTWLAAMRRYRTGLCNREPRIGYTAVTAMRLAEITMQRAGIELPERWR